MWLERIPVKMLFLAQKPKKLAPSSLPSASHTHTTPSPSSLLQHARHFLIRLQNAFIISSASYWRSTHWLLSGQMVLGMRPDSDQALDPTSNPQEIQRTEGHAELHHEDAISKTQPMATLQVKWPASFKKKIIRKRKGHKGTCRLKVDQNAYQIRKW